MSTERKFLQREADQEERIAVFIDYKNIEPAVVGGSVDTNLEFLTFLEKKVLAIGRIIFPFIFIPEHYLSRAPVRRLIQNYGFLPIICIRKVEGVIQKDADTVDEMMKELTWKLIDHSDITQVIIMTGDRDFQSLSIFARQQGKKVTVFSTKEALSASFLQTPGIEVETIPSIVDHSKP